MTQKLVCLAFIGCALAASQSATRAGGMQPGDSVGQAYAVPLPEGVYTWATVSYGARPGSGGRTVEEDSLVNIGALLWSTPWTPLGGRLEFATTFPQVSASFHDSVGGPVPHSVHGVYNSIFTGIWAFNFGNGFNASVMSGFYFPENTGPYGVWVNSWTAREALNIAYEANGWKAAANLNYQFQGHNFTTDARDSNDNFVYDLTLTKAFDEWELGPVAFGSTDVNSAASPLQKSQFAVGGLVGYNFGPVITQLYVTHDVAQHNMGGYETRVWSRIIAPLWNPESDPSPRIARKF
jgi:hypothetical protein